LLYDTLSVAWEATVAGETLSLNQRADLLLAMTHAVRSATQAVELAYSVAGTSGFRTGRPLERYFRDTQVLKHHAFAAETRYEAVTRPPMRVVPIRRVEPQDLQALHRARERLMDARTASVNEIRGLLGASGMVLPRSVAGFRAIIVAKLEADQAELTALSTGAFRHLYRECLALETRLAYYDEGLTAMGQAHPEGQRLQTIPGVGPVSAAAPIAAIGDVPQFKNGRQPAARRGLVPRERSTGGTPRLLGISTRGDRDLRKLLVHGARATLRWVDTKSDDRSRWLRALLARRGKNRAAVA
jgi:transposase